MQEDPMHDPTFIRTLLDLRMGGLEKELKEREAGNDSSSLSVFKLR
jgi:hypothetical protein